MLDSEKRGYCAGSKGAVCRGKEGGRGIGGSAVRAAKEVKSRSVGGGAVSPILASAFSFGTKLGRSRWLSRRTHQQPPAASLRSNTRITSNACSFTNASSVIAPEGPAPMTATRFLPWRCWDCCCSPIFWSVDSSAFVSSRCRCRCRCRRCQRSDSRGHSATREQNESSRY